MAPCVLGAAIVPAGNATIGTSTSSLWVPTVPVNSVKFEPIWTQVDMNIAKIFNIGTWRYDARLEAFNLLNNGVEVWHSGSRNGFGTTPAGFQSIGSWERADTLLNGRVLRVAVTARF